MIRDTFAWWADIWIPSAVGLATVSVAVVAIVISRQAAQIARDSEAARLSEISRQSETDARNRLRDMARDDAILLNRWARLKIQASPWSPDPIPPERNHYFARTSAQIALEQSFVEGAIDIFELTDFDLKNRWSNLPEETPQTNEYGDKIASPLREALIADRDARTMERIRLWGLDPEAQAPAIAAELANARDDWAAYLDVGRA